MSPSHPIRRINRQIWNSLAIFYAYQLLASNNSIKHRLCWDFFFSKEIAWWLRLLFYKSRARSLVFVPSLIRFSFSVFMYTFLLWNCGLGLLLLVLFFCSIPKFQGAPMFKKKPPWRWKCLRTWLRKRPSQQPQPQPKPYSHHQPTLWKKSTPPSQPTVCSPIWPYPSSTSSATLLRLHTHEYRNSDPPSPFSTPPFPRLGHLRLPSRPPLHRALGARARMRSRRIIQIQNFQQHRRTDYPFVTLRTVPLVEDNAFDTSQEHE